MKIKNIDGLSADDLQQRVNKGARFVYYPFIISLLIVTFKRTSGVYLVNPQESKLKRTVLYILISFLFGWWGIPHGPKFTISSIMTNIAGGKDVTDEVMATVKGFVLFTESEHQKKAQAS